MKVILKSGHVLFASQCYDTVQAAERENFTHRVKLHPHGDTLPERFTFQIQIYSSIVSHGGVGGLLLYSLIVFLCVCLRAVIISDFQQTIIMVKTIHGNNINTISIENLKKKVIRQIIYNFVYYTSSLFLLGNCHLQWSFQLCIISQLELVLGS